MTLKLVVNNTPKKLLKKILSHEELMTKVSTGATVHDREQIILQNLKDMGL